MQVENLLDRADRGGTASRIDRLSKPRLLIATERLAEQIEGIGDAFDLGRKRLELDLGDERKIVGAAGRTRHEPKTQCRNEEPRSSQAQSHDGVLEGFGRAGRLLEHTRPTS